MLKKNKKNPEFQEIYGFHSVFSALQNKERQHFNIYIIEKYQSFVKKYSNKIQNINILTNKEMAKLFGNESVTQGIVMQRRKHAIIKTMTELLLGYPCLAQTVGCSVSQFSIGWIHFKIAKD